MRPNLSIIIPMRNEARDAVQALTSIASIVYPRLEILIVDDGSTDHTAQLVGEFIKLYRGDKCFRLLAAPADPPAGWVGKTFAADYAIAHSSGELILICDADVTHTPHSLSAVVNDFQTRRLELLSLLPHFDIRSWGEYPLLFQTFLLYAASRAARALGSRQSFGMGTYLLFTRDFYNRSGGWSVHREYPESLPLINYCTQHGGSFAFLPDRGRIAARMHDGAARTFWGLVRNSNFALLQPVPLILFVSYVTLSAAALGHAATGNLLGIATLAAMTGLFTAHLIRSGYPLRIVVGASVLSVGMPFYLLAVATTAILRRLFNVPLSWRGRYMRPQ